MKLLTILLLAAPLFGQYSAIPAAGTTGYDAIINGKPTVTFGAGVPSANCTKDLDLYLNTSASTNGWYFCSATNTWSLWVTLPTFPAGTIVGTNDTQTLTNKTLDGVSPTTMGYLDPTSSIQTQLNGKASAAAVPTQLPVFGGSTASSVTFSTTPIFSLAAVSSQSPLYFNFAAMTANVTAVTFTNKTAGAQFSIRFLQDGTGGRTVAYGSSVSSATTCGAPDPGANVVSVQSFLVESDGATVDCTAFESFPPWRGIGGPETSSSPVPASGVDHLFFSNTHQLQADINGAAAAKIPLMGTNSGTAGAALCNDSTATSSGGPYLTTSGCSSGGGNSFVDYITSGGSVSGNSTDQALVTYSAPALPAGACYHIQFEIRSATNLGSTKIKVDGTTIATPFNAAGLTDVKSDVDYCNNAGVQNAQTFIYHSMFYANAGTGAVNVYANGTNGSPSDTDNTVITPSAVNWSSGHTITLTSNYSSGTQSVAAFLLNAH